MIRLIIHAALILLALGFSAAVQAGSYRLEVLVCEKATDDCATINALVTSGRYEDEATWCERFATSKGWDMARGFLPAGSFTVPAVHCERIA